MTAVFVYGTLLHVPLLEIVLGRTVEAGDLVAATLDGARVSWVRDQPYPMIRLDENDQASGMVIKGLGEDDLARLDFYEGGFDYALVRVETSAGPAQMYLPSPEVGPVGPPFDINDWVRDYGTVTRYAAQEAMLYFRKRTAQELVQIFPRILSRAYSRLRASQYEPTEFNGRLDIETVDAPYSEFFAVRRHRLQVQTFDGPMAAPIDRAVFWAADAALLLPYDHVRDRVLLLEQARFGPMARGDARAWSLEPVGGMIDPGETPETTAVRETYEETGLTVTRVEAIPSGYPSPGTSSEYYYAFLGLADIPDDVAGVSGVAEENENIRTHIFSYDEFMDAIDTGRICIVPLIMMGLWLARNRDRLRAA